MAEAYALLTRAVDQGYGGALRVDRSNLDAKLGVADVFLLAGKLKAKDGEAQASQENFGRSVAAYREALEEKFAGLGFVEWCDAVYNYACAGRLLMLFLVRLLYHGHLTNRENVAKGVMHHDLSYALGREERIIVMQCTSMHMQLPLRVFLGLHIDRALG